MALRQLRSADAALIVQACGYDALYLDLEHSPMSAAEAANICITAVALGITPFVRVPSATGDHIGRTLDGGALGVIVPQVTTRAEAEAAVRHAKFPPLGERSVSLLNPTMKYRQVGLADSIRMQNDATMVIAMLESAQGVANAADIAAVPGIDLIMIGPNDLSAELGVAGETKHSKIADAYRTVAAACARHGKHFVATSSGGPDLAELVAMGARFIVGGNDVGFLVKAAKQGAESIRAMLMASTSPRR